MVGFTLSKYGLFKADRWDVFCKKCRELSINPETVRCEPNENSTDTSKSYRLIGKSLDSSEEIEFGYSNKPISKLKR